jgi:hypothetical protein
MKKLNFAFFVGDGFYPPFDPSIIEFIEQDSEGSLLFDTFYYLYAAVNYEFSSPGNSVGRVLVVDLNWRYCVHHPLETTKFHRHSKGNDSLNKEYDNLMLQLLDIAFTYRFRTLTDEQLSFLKTIDVSTGCHLHSSNLTNDGMSVFLNSYTNLPPSIRDSFYF